MGKALFAVVLIAASFAGGAVVNGPGLRWAQTMILDRLGGEDEEDGASGEPASPAKASEVSPPEPFPSPPVSPLDVGPAPAPPSSPSKEPKAEAKGPAPASAPTLVPAVVETPLLKPAPTPEPKAPEPPEEKPTNDPRLALVNAQAPATDRGPPPLEPFDPMPLAIPNDRPAAGDVKGQEAPWADARDSAPAAAVPPRPFEPARVVPGAAPAPSPTPEAPAAPTAARPSSEWTELRRKMTALGVTRYGFEGEPAGRVRFHCLIPLAGRRAVAQQFEAEGDDELQAAEITLRRVALWRATESPGP